MNIIEMYENKNVITWSLPSASEVSKRTVEYLTEEEKKHFKEFMLAFGANVVVIVALMCL